MTYCVWPAGTDFDQNFSKHVVIKIGDRCKRWRRVDYDIQCKHEQKISGKFKKEHGVRRWFSRREYNPVLGTVEA